MDHLAHSVLKEIGFTLLAEGKTLKVKAEGYSMYPSIKPGSVIYIEPVEPDNEPVVGNIIAWKKESGFVVHRLIKVIEKRDENLFVTRGDSCIAEDEPVTFELLAGRVVKVENPDGNAIQILAKKNKIPRYRINRLRVWVLLKFLKLRQVLKS